MISSLQVFSLGLNEFPGCSSVGLDDSWNPAQVFKGSHREKKGGGKKWERAGKEENKERGEWIRLSR